MQIISYVLSPNIKDEKNCEKENEFIDNDIVNNIIQELSYVISNSKHKDKYKDKFIKMLNGKKVKKALIEHGPLIVIICTNPCSGLHATVLNGWVDTSEDDGYWLIGTSHVNYYPKPFPTGSQ